jgi:hypothetical protein
MQKSFFLVTVLASTLTLAAATTVALAQSEPEALLKKYYAHSSGFSGAEVQGRTDSLPKSGFAG